MDWVRRLLVTSAAKDPPLWSADRDVKRGAVVAEEIGGHFLPCDITEEEEVGGLFRRSPRWADWWRS